MALTLLIGGARSGKSALAVEMGRRHTRFGGRVTLIATAPIVDDDMARRVERHRAERPADWSTVEEQRDLATTLDECGDDLVIIDCLTLWTSNLLLAERTDDEIVERATRAAQRAAERTSPTVAITNEVGLGVHPETELGRRYRDVHGHVNRVWAAAADQSLLLVAGRALPLTDPWLHL